MARCRNLKPGFFTNDKLGELPALARLLFAGLWCLADRDGRLEDRPKRIKAEILPYDDCDLEELLELLSRGDDPFIIRYQVAHQRYIQVCRFSEHQYPHHTEKASVIPVPPLDSRSAPVIVHPLEVRGKRIRGIEVTRKGDARGKPKRKPVEAADVPVPDGFGIPAVRKAIGDWLAYKAERGEAYRDASYLGRKVAEFATAGPAAFVAAVNSSIGSNYAGLFPVKEGTNGNAKRITSGQVYDPASADGNVIGW